MGCSQKPRQTFRQIPNLNLVLYEQLKHHCDFFADTTYQPVGFSFKTVKKYNYEHRHPFH